jgi:TPR repeat protein
MFTQQMQNAEKGIPGCMFQVGQFYLHGRGTTKNVEEGLRWCTKAAEAGDAESARFLSFLYGSGGLGVPINRDKAAYWKSVVEKGNGT